MRRRKQLFGCQIGKKFDFPILQILVTTFYWKIPSIVTWFLDRLGTSRQNGKPSQAKPGKKLGLLRKPSRPLCKIPNRQAQAKPSFAKSLP